MNDLICITSNDKFPVNGRTLHETLGVGSHYKDWFPRMREYGFIEGEDFNTLKNVRVQIEGEREVSREITEHMLTISMAKEICMLQRNDKGKEIRRYLIEIEEQWNQPDAIIARALQMACKQLDETKQLVSAMKPKADFFDAVAGSKTAISFEQAAKVLELPGIGRNKLFERLRDKGILKQDNLPYQEYVDRGYFRVVEQKYSKPTGEVIVSTKTLIYQRGLDYIRKLLSA